MPVQEIQETAHPSFDERMARGREAAGLTPASIHAGWKPAVDRPDPVALLEAQNLTREPDLVPVRHGRMMASPFTFYRGAAKIMAADLAGTPVAGLDAQLCGDSHLSNFGLFASPERILMFDLNDFDETLPGPFEYDVKRMAASFTIAARNNGFSEGDTRGDARVGGGVPGGDGLVRADGDDGHLVRPPGRGRAHERGPRRTRRDREGQEGQEGEERGRGQEVREAAREGRGKDPREGSCPRQPAGAVEAR